MYIVSKSMNSIVNMSHVTAIFLGLDNCTIRAEFKNGSGYQLGRYCSITDTRVAMGILADSIGKTEVCFMPDDECVKAKIHADEQRYHHKENLKRGL